MQTLYGHRPGITLLDSCPHCGEPRTDGMLCFDCANEVRSEADARADRMAWEIDTYDEARPCAQEDGR